VHALGHLGKRLGNTPFRRGKHNFLRFVDLWLTHKNSLPHSDACVLTNETVYPYDALVPILTIGPPDFCGGTSLANDLDDFSRRQLKLQKCVWVKSSDTPPESFG